MPDKKIIIITGATSGIGFEVAEQLAQAGHRIVIVGRDEAKLIGVHKLLVEKTGNAGIFMQIADLSLQKSIRKLAADLHEQFDYIDVLINNAGAVYSKFTLTADRIEKTIATNHFSYFLLTNLLSDLLKKSEQGRIINVASNGHFSGKIDIKSFTRKKNYFILRAYAQSKLANVLFTYELSKHLKGTPVTVNALHPGRVRTRIGNKDQPWYVSLGWSLALLLSSVSIRDAARTYIYLATSEDVKAATGKYYYNCKEKRSSTRSYDKNLMQLLWKASEDLCKEKF